MNHAKPKKIGEIIQSARVRARLSQGELADMIGVTQTDVSRWENNLHEPSLKNIVLLCEKLGMHIGELMEGR